MANKNKITILNEKEKELLRKTNSVIAYDIYFHLKDDDSYFKGEFYDLKRCIADYLNIPERTVKDVLKRLKNVGLVQTRKQGKVNLYTLPYNKKFSIRGNKEIKEIDDYGRKEATVVQEEQPTEQEQVSRGKQQETFQEREEQNEFEVEEYIDLNLNKVLVPYLQHKGEEYYSQLSKLTEEINSLYPDISTSEINEMIEDEVRRKAKKAS